MMPFLDDISILSKDPFGVTSHKSFSDDILLVQF